MKRLSTTTVKKYKAYTVLGNFMSSRRNALLIFLVVFGGVGGYLFLFGSSAAPVPPSMYLSPTTRTMAVDTTFTVQVRAHSGTTAVNAVQANLTYPTNLLSFVSIDATGSAFTTDAPSSGGNGQVSISRGLIGSTTGDQLVATITFKTLTTGGAATIAFANGTALVESTNNTDILGSLAATEGGTYNIDNAPPTVTVTTPTNGAVVAGGSTVAISAGATDNFSAITAVEIFIDGVKVATLPASPYNYSWNTTGIALGSHTIQAKATDALGNLGSSALATVTVADQTAPTTSITSPTSNANIAGTITVSSNASDNTGGSGLSKVEFYVDAVLKGTDTVTPYTFSWDSRTAADGQRALTVKAYDNASPANITTSATVTVRVDNAVPTTPGNLRTTGNTLNSIALAWNASTDANGVTGYRVQRNGTTITTTAGNVLTYNNTGLTPGTSYTYTVQALDATGNVSAAATLVASTMTAKVGDFNGDNAVNITDLSILLSHWATNDPATDINHDGTVNIFDLSALLSRWGT